MQPPGHTDPAHLPLTLGMLPGLMVDFWADSRHTLTTPLTPEQAQKRLAARLKPEPGRAPKAFERPLAGRVHAGGFSLSLRDSRQQMLPTQASGRWEATGAHLHVTVRYGVPMIFKIAVGGWLGLCLAVSAAYPLAYCFAPSMIEHTYHGRPLPMSPTEVLVHSLVPLGFFIGGLFVSATWRLLATGDEEPLRAAIEDALRNP